MLAWDLMNICYNLVVQALQYHLKLPGLSSSTLNADLKSSNGPLPVLLLLLFAIENPGPILFEFDLGLCPPKWGWTVVAFVFIDDDLLVYVEWLSDLRIPALLPPLNSSSPLPLFPPTPDKSESVIGWSPLYASKLPLWFPVPLPPIVYKWFNERQQVKWSL